MTIKLPPGVARGASAAELPGRWYETHLVRWVNGVLRPCGGIEKLVSDDVVSGLLVDDVGDFLTDGDDDFLGLDDSSGKIRALHSWLDNSGIKRTAELWDDRLLVYENGAIIDITPIGGMTGPNDNLLAGGYGDGEYGVGTYGTPRPDKEALSPIGPAFSLSNWGENLVAMTSYDGRLLMWVPNSIGDVAEAVVGAPVSNRMFVITEQRHVALFGMGGEARRWGWCSQEDINDWDFGSITNTAGEYYIEPAAPITSARAMKNGILYFTGKGKGVMCPYTGVPYIYGQEGIGENIAPLSAAALVEYSNGVAWVGKGQVYTYDGSSLTPIPCEIYDWFNNVRSVLYANYRISGHALGIAPEVWWHFPMMGATENNAYIAWNYIDQTWSMGFISRTCGIPEGLDPYPIMSDGSFLYFHEKGKYYGNEELPYAETAAINVDAGASLSTLSQAIPDHGVANDDVVYTFYGRMGRTSPRTVGEFTKGPLVTRSNGYLDIRAKARDHRMRIQMARNGADPFTFGQMLIDVKKGSKR